MAGDKTVPVRKRHVLASALLAATLLSLVIGWMIESRARIIRDGIEIVLTSEPIDPRDLLRGHYVRLTYPAAMIGEEAAKGVWREPDAPVLRDADVYVLLQRSQDKTVTVHSVSLTRPEYGIVLKTKAPYLVARPQSLFLDFGIDRFYADPVRAKLLETRMRDGEVTEVVVALSLDGTPQIKGLRQAGEEIMVESPY